MPAGSGEGSAPSRRPPKRHADTTRRRKSPCRSHRRLKTSRTSDSRIYLPLQDWNVAEPNSAVSGRTLVYRFFMAFLPFLIRGLRVAAKNLDSGETAGVRSFVMDVPRARVPAPLEWPLAVLIVAGVTGVAWMILDPGHLPDAVMLYLLGVLIASLRLRRGPSLAAALLSVVVFDFVFIPPRSSFLISDVRHLVTFVVMLLVALVINRLAQNARQQA